MYSSVTIYNDYLTHKDGCFDQGGIRNPTCVHSTGSRRYEVDMRHTRHAVQEEEQAGADMRHTHHTVQEEEQAGVIGAGTRHSVQEEEQGKQGRSIAT